MLELKVQDLASDEFGESKFLYRAIGLVFFVESWFVLSLGVGLTSKGWLQVLTLPNVLQASLLYVLVIAFLIKMAYLFALYYWFELQEIGPGISKLKLVFRDLKRLTLYSLSRHSSFHKDLLESIAMSVSAKLARGEAAAGFLVSLGMQVGASISSRETIIGTTGRAFIGRAWPIGLIAVLALLVLAMFALQTCFSVPHEVSKRNFLVRASMRRRRSPKVASIPTPDRVVSERLTTRTGP